MTIIIIIVLVSTGSFTLQRVVIKAMLDSSSSSSSLSSSSPSSQQSSQSNDTTDNKNKDFVAIVPTHASYAVITPPHNEDLSRLRLQLVVDETLPASAGRVVVISNLCDVVTYGK